jgi:DNA topoisomerase-2
LKAVALFSFIVLVFVLFPPQLPLFKNFRGTIEQLEEQKYVVHGEIAILDNQTVEITELPIRTWTQAYKESVLEPMLQGSDKVPAQIT